MSDDKEFSGGLSHDFSQLRRRAEKLQRPINPEDTKKMTLQEVHHLVQELQTFQVELEMQNHQLQMATQELEAAQAKYRDLYFHSPFGYVTLDEHGVIEEANAKAMEILGTPKQNLEERRFSLFVHQESLDSFYGFFKKVLLSNAPVTAELQLQTHTSTLLHAQLEGVLLLRENEPGQVRIAFLDVTERKEAHLALHNQQALLSAIVNSSLNAIQVFKAERGREGSIIDFEWLLLNRTAELFMDKTLAELRGQRLTKVLPFLLTGGLFHTLVQVTETGTPATFATSLEKEGKNHWLNCVAVKLDDGLVLTFEDVTLQRLADEKLQESQLLVKKMAEAFPDFLYVEDLVQGRNLYNNRDFLAFLGYQKSDMKGHPRELLDSIYHPQDAHLLLERAQRAKTLPEGEVLESKVRVKTKGGTYRTVLFRDTVFKRGAAGQPIQMVGMAQDITAHLAAEEELRQKAATIQAILQNIPVIIWRIDAEGRILESVGSGLQKLGHQDHVLEGSLITEVNPSIVPHIQSVLAGNSEVFISEIEVDGQKVFKQNYFLHDQETGGGIGFCLDVTAQRNAEETAQHQTMLLEQLLQNLPLVLAILDSEGNYLEAKGKGLGSVGLQEDDLQGKNLYQFFPFLKNNIKEVLAGKVKSFTAEFPYQGKHVYFQSFGFLDKKKDRGIAFGIDITDLKEVQEKLLREKEFSESLLETHLHGVMALDQDLHITAWNKAMEDNTTLNRQQVLGQPIQQLLTGKGLPKVLQKLKRVLQGEQASFSSLSFLPKERSFEINFTPVYSSEQQVSGILGLVQDVTLQKQRQQENTQLQLTQQKDVIDAILVTQNQERKRIAEALHNSLAQLLYAAKLNLEDTQTEGTDEKSLKSSLKRVTEFLEEAIKETRTLAHELIPRVLVDLGLKSALKDLATRLSTPSFAVQCVVTGFNEPKDYEFETHIFRFVQELLNNIMKHAEATEALVQVVDKGKIVRVRVEDNGKGMAQSTLDRTQTKGMGLITIRNQVKLLKGSIQIESSADQGTVVILELPH